MRRTLSKAKCINNITVFSFLTLTCMMVLAVFVTKLVEDMSEKAEIFVPGIAVLFAGVILVLIFSLTRIVKYVKLLKKL